MVELECVVVGATAEGILAAQKIKSQTGRQPTLLESHQVADGSWRARRLMLTKSQWANNLVQPGPELAPLKIRNNKQWLNFNELKFDGDWCHDPKTGLPPPQWKELSEASFCVVESVSMNSEEFNSIERSPVQEIHPKDNHWEIVTPKETFIAKEIVWASGLDSLKSAMGRQQFQKHTQANPEFLEWAEDYQNGIYLTLKSSEPLVWNDQAPAQTLLGFGVKHDGLRLLAIAAMGNNPNEVKIYVSLPKHWLEDVKIVASFQKSLRRSVQTWLQCGPSPMEFWVVGRGPCSPVQAVPSLWMTNQQNFRVVGEVESVDGRTLGTLPLESI